MIYLPTTNFVLGLFAIPRLIVGRAAPKLSRMTDTPKVGEPRVGQLDRDPIERHHFGSVEVLLPPFAIMRTI